MYLLLQKFETKSQHSLKTWLFICQQKSFQSKKFWYWNDSLVCVSFLSFFSPSLLSYPNYSQCLWDVNSVVEHEQVSHLWLVSKLKNRAISGFLIKAKMGTKVSDSILFSISACIIFLSQWFFFQFQQNVGAFQTKFFFFFQIAQLFQLRINLFKGIFT